MLAALHPPRQSNVIPLSPAERGGRLLELQRLLAERFPAEPVLKTGLLPTGLAAIDRVEGGLRRGALTEISGTPAGSSLLLNALLGMLGREKCLGALVDCGKFFDPGSFPSAGLQRLLWVRCGLPAEAVKAADLLLRDGNLSLLLLDLLGATERGLGRVPASTWHRFQRVAEQGNMALVVFTPRPLVEGASVRIAVDWRGDFEAMAERRVELLARLAARISSRRSLALPEPATRRIA